MYSTITGQFNPNRFVYEPDDGSFPYRDPIPRSYSALNQPSMDRDRILKITDLADPIIVSYIAEYIDFTSTRIGTDCYKLIAMDLVEKELSAARNSSEDFDGFISIPGPGDTLAYYPPRDYRERGQEDFAALKYYVAKEVNSFLGTFQNLVSDVVRGADTNLPQRDISLAFLDRIETVGWNISEENNPDEPEMWVLHGEGLYMQYYVRRASTPAGALEYRSEDVV